MWRWEGSSSRRSDFGTSFFHRNMTGFVPVSAGNVVRKRSGVEGRRVCRDRKVGSGGWRRAVVKMGLDDEEERAR